MGCESVESVWTIDSLGTKIAYVGGGHFHKRKGFGAWTIDSSSVIGNKLLDGTNISLPNIRGNSSTDLICAGDWGFVSHWNGKTWKRYDTLFNPGNGNYYTGAFDFKGKTACIVGSKNGTSWIAVGRRK